jgi:hypothetical protein
MLPSEPRARRSCTMVSRFMPSARENHCCGSTTLHIALVDDIQMET